jgi:predicted MFS family arabinose efflux permease
MLVIAMSAIGLRLLAYSATTVSWLILLIQVVHGLTFATVYTAGVYFADQVSPPGMKATSQAMFSTTLMGFGAGAGGLLGGVLMDRFSPSMMYAIMGGLVLAGLLFFLLLERRLVVRREASES